MFTRFSAPRRPRPSPIAAPFVSLTAHAVIVLATTGGFPVPLASPAPRDAAPGGADEERVRWVGSGGAAAGESTRRGALPPIAYVIPGRGPLRVGLPTVTGPGARRPRARRDELPAAAVPRRPDAGRLRYFVRLPVLPPAVEAAVLVPGVSASAPDFSRVPARAEELVRRETAELLAQLTARAEVRMTEMPRPVGPVDVLPIAFVTNPLPTYPAALARAGLGGRVVVEFAIDSVGQVSPGSLTVLESTDSLLTQAVRAVVPRLRFLPAQLGPNAVRVTVRQPFLFRVRARS